MHGGIPRGGIRRAGGRYQIRGEGIYQTRGDQTRGEVSRGGGIPRGRYQTHGGIPRGRYQTRGEVADARRYQMRGAEGAYVRGGGGGGGQEER